MATLKSNGGENSIGSRVHKEDGWNDEHFNNFTSLTTLKQSQNSMVNINSIPYGVF